MLKMIKCHLVISVETQKKFSSSRSLDCHYEKVFLKLYCIYSQIIPFDYKLQIIKVLNFFLRLQDFTA